MTREPIEVTRQDRIYCLKVSSDYHSEVCEECKFYPNCDHMTQDDMTELTIKDLEALEQEPFINKSCVSSEVCEHDKNKVLDKIRAEISTVYESLDGYDPDSLGTFVCRIDDIIDKYRAENEPRESED